ncbi:unnamed protein product [Pylaiella littoralis]
MAGLEFDGLLSSHSVFVSPVDRYGQQNTIDRYTRSKAIDAGEVGGGYDPERDPHWRWAGPADTGDSDRLDDLLAGPESGLAHSVMFEAQHEHQQQQQQQQQQQLELQQQQRPRPAGEQDHFAVSSPERLPADDDGDSWEDRSDIVGDNFDDAADRSWVRRPSVESVDDGHRHDGDDGTLVQHGAPSPVVESAAPAAPVVPAAAPPPTMPPPSASHSFEDQPVRGLADAKEKSLDELIAQGERQMREAQARTALIKPSLSSTAVVATPAAATARAQASAGIKNDEDNSGSSSKSGRWIGQRPVGHSVEMQGGPRRGPMASSRDGSSSSSSSVHSPIGSNLARGGGGGLRVSLRSGASFATSWSGGDLSMGVMPAVAAGAGGQNEEDESREERERREFYELEMELLREEESGEGAAAVAAAAAGDAGFDFHRQGGNAVAESEEHHEQHHDNFWDHEREGVVEGLQFESAANSKSRHLRWGSEAVETDSAHLAAAGRYQPLSEHVGVEGGSAGNTDDHSTRASHPQAMSPGGGGLRVTATSRCVVVHSDAEEESAWQGSVQIIPGGGLGGDTQRQNCIIRGGERMPRDEDGEDIRRWEVEEDNRDDDWPSQERDEWGQTVMRRGGSIQEVSQHAGQRMDALAMGSRRTVSGASSDEAGTTSTRRLQHNRLTHGPPSEATVHADDALPHENGGSSSVFPDERKRAGEQHSDAFEDDQAWGDVGNATAVVERAPSPGGAPRRNVNAGQQQGFPAGGRGVDVVDVGAPWSSQAPPEESGLPSPAGTPPPPPLPPPPPQGAPLQSKLVQRVFGARGRRGGARGGGGRGRHQASSGNGRGPRAGEGVNQEEGGQGGGSWAVQAELQGKLRELEEEVSRYKEENERARLARRKQETALAEVMRKRQEVREWAEAEKAAVEAWCAEQRQASAREKRTALKQLQGLRARSQAGGSLGGGTAVERRQRQEIEGFKATIERAKLDAETAKKKARASERRLQQQIKAGAERVAELEGQVSFLERQRVDALARSKGAGVLGGVGRPSKASASAGMSRSVNGGTMSIRKSANSIAMVRGAPGLAATEGASVTARGGGGRGTVATVDFAAESSSARRSRWPAKRNQEQEYEGGEREAFAEERAIAARDRWERQQEEEEVAEGANARSHRGESRSGSQGRATAARGGWKQDGGDRFGSNAYTSPVHESADPGLRQYEGEPGQQLGHEHRWAGDEGVGDGGRDARWEEEAVGEGGRQHLDSEAPGRRSDGGLPWRTDHSDARRDPNGSNGRSAASRMHGDAGQPPLNGLQHTDRAAGGSNGPRFRDCDRVPDEQHPDRQQEVHHAAASTFLRPTRMEINGRRGSEALVREGAAVSRESNGDGDRPPLEASWRVRRSASSPDGVKYDPMRYETAVVSQGSAAAAAAAAAEGGEHGAWAGAYPDLTRGERAGGREGMRTSSSHGRQSMRASASAAVVALDRTSALRHSDAAGTTGMGRGVGHPQFGEVLLEGAAGAGAAGAGDDDDDDDARVGQAEAGDSSSGGGGGGGGGARPQNWGRFNDEDRKEDSEFGNPAFTGGRSRPERGRKQAAMAQTVSGADGVVSHPAERERAHVYGGAGAAPDPTAVESLSASAGAGRELPSGSGASGSGGKVEHVLRDGRRVILFANGTQKETLPDGGCVVRFVNGDLKRVEGGTGVVVYTYAAARTTHTMHPSGLEVFEFPNGQVERHHKTGEKEIDFPDGTRKYILPSGREMSEFPDGVTVVEYPEGHRDVTSPDGTTHRERPDGTVQAEPARAGGLVSAEGGRMGATEREGIHPKLVTATGTSRGGW